MSGQWEVVGKNKKDKQTGKNKKLSKNEKKKFVDNAPKVEDLLPLAQVKTLYAALDTNKEPAKPVEKAIKTKENEAKKAQKKPKEKKENSNVKENNKPPKTIEAAVALITSSDVENLLEVGQLRFAEAPLVWLKGLASWLNTKLPVDHTDNAFTAKSWEYPLCLLTADTRAVLKKALKDVPEPTVQMFYDYCLTSMANDMTKGSPVTGYKMLLQLVASQQPGVAVSDVVKSATVRHSYQNRPAIGCSIMWALGQAGFKDLPVGLKVWQEVMFPVCELRHYTHFVCDYLKHLVARHSTSKALTAYQYLDILDTALSSRLAADNQLKTHLRSLQRIMCNVQPDNRLHNIFEPLLFRLSVNNSPALKDEVVRLLAECLAGDTQSYTVWRTLYTKHLVHSAVLLKHINNEWSTLKERLPSKPLKHALKIFKATNNDMIKSKLNLVGLQQCTILCDALLSKMAEGKSFPWKTLGFVLFLALAGVVAFDVNMHGSFKGSKTGILLRDIGALEYGERAVVQVQEMSQQAYRWSQQNVPVYTAKAWEVAGPYVLLVADSLSALGSQVVSSINMVVESCKPLVEEWVNKYAPGLLDALAHAWDVARQYGLQAAALVLKYLNLAFQWLRNDVFVGKLSPENLQRVTLEALNTTQTFAAQTFSWLNSKVITAGSKGV